MELRNAYLEKLAERSADCDIPAASPDAPSIAISIEMAAKMVNEAGKSISNCPITSIRFEVFQAMIGKASTPEERPSLLAFSRLLHDFVMSEYCLIFKN